MPVGENSKFEYHIKNEEQSPKPFGQQSAEFGFAVMQFNVQEEHAERGDSRNGFGHPKNEAGKNTMPDDLNKSEKIPERKQINRDDILISDDLPNL